MAASSTFSSSSASMARVLSPKVFVNFRGKELRDNFISHLIKAFEENDINFFADKHLVPSERIKTLFKHIDESKIALTVFSIQYTESKWCLKELVKIMENEKQKKIRFIPIFFNVTVDNVKIQTGKFGDSLKERHGEHADMPKWQKALTSVPEILGINKVEYRDENALIVEIVKTVKKVQDIVCQGGGPTDMVSTNISSVTSSGNILSETIEEPRMEQLVRELKKKLFKSSYTDKSRIVGIVGMPGIGKTTLAETYFDKGKEKFFFMQNISGIREKSEQHGSGWLAQMFTKKILEKLMNGEDDDKAQMFTKKILETLKAHIFTRKILETLMNGEDDDKAQMFTKKILETLKAQMFTKKILETLMNGEDEDKAQMFTKKILDTHMNDEDEDKAQMFTKEILEILMNCEDDDKAQMFTKKILETLMKGEDDDKAQMFIKKFLETLMNGEDDDKAQMFTKKILETLMNGEDDDKAQMFTKKILEKLMSGEDDDKAQMFTKKTLHTLMNDEDDDKAQMFTKEILQTLMTAKNPMFTKKILHILMNDEDNDKAQMFTKEILHTLMNAKAPMFTERILVVLDDVSHKDQIDFLLENRESIVGGSKIIITTRDKSSIEEVVDDTYVVLGLDDKEALQLFDHHAKRSFPELSKRFVEYAGGNPLALEELGKELCGKEEDHWEARLETLPHCCNPKILIELRFSYDKLSDQQKDTFLDIACFFRSEEEDYVKCLLDPYVPESGEAVRELAEKLLICISAGRIEMHNLFCTLGKELGSSDENKSGKRMWNHDKTIETLWSKHVKEDTHKVRGIFLDTSKLEGSGKSLKNQDFIHRFNPQNLRYLKICDSLCPQECKVDRKINLPEGLTFPFQEIRYFHWLKFPLDELPSDFNPENLIDLKLPYSKIKRIWKATKETPQLEQEDLSFLTKLSDLRLTYSKIKHVWKEWNATKETPQLKWVDLSFSTKLSDLSALSNAFNLRKLNLEGCTNLSTLPREMKNMKSLVFINLRGCVMLSSLPAKLHLISLKTLILSGCSKFDKFELNSENLEFLHLDGTAIKSLPKSIKHFQKLVILNLKDCKMLESLPDYLYKLKALAELILSGCVLLTSFPDIKENMENLQILLLDGTSIKEIPNMLLHCLKFEDQVVCQLPIRMNGVSLLRRLCLSRNKMICCLGDTSQLYQLKWIDLKYCESLRFISTLPPNLQCLDAHHCSSLKAVASPLALLMSTTQQVPASFIFTNCGKLEQAAKTDIACYAHNKSRLLSEALKRQNKGCAFKTLVATCFPGSEVPAWFSHRASGAELKPELPVHRSENGPVGIALCAIVSFDDYKTRNNNLQLKCRYEFNDVETPSSTFNFHIGGLSETGDDERTIKSTHVFIGYTNWLDIKTCQAKDKKCVPTKASINFKVTDGTNEVMNCEVLKCGFGLVYESSSWEASLGTE